MSVGVSPFEVETGAGIAGLRAAGLLRLEAERGGGQTFAAEIDEQGPLRVRFPRIAADGVLEGVLVNTGGGIVGGDSLRFEIEAGEGAHVALTTQASEKIYRSTGADATVDVSLHAASKSSLAWVPQESILFDRARVLRTIEADAASDATLTICESVVFGRAAMGETVANGELKDRWRIRRDGKLVFADAVTLDENIGALLSRPAIARGAIAAGTIIQLSPDAEAKIDAVRAALAHDGVEAGASAFDGMIVIRMIARDSIALRAAVLATLFALGAEPPRAFSL
jgi:urease accessory protein